jgi:hypothetical protein
VRKGIVIGLLAVVVIGVLAFWVSQPKKGSVEWHKREYLAARKRLFDDTWADRMRNFYCRITKTPHSGRHLSAAEWDKLTQRMQDSWESLVALGYLNRHEFYLAHQPKSRAHLLERAALTQFPPDAIWSVGGGAGAENLLVVYATANDLPRWRNLIGRLDVPERSDAQVRQALTEKVDGP